MLPLEALEIAIKELGTQTALAKAIGVQTGHIFYWKGADEGRGYVPAEHAVAIDRATGGRVRCEDLCPDVDWAHVRANAEPVAVAAKV